MHLSFCACCLGRRSSNKTVKEKAFLFDRYLQKSIFSPRNMFAIFISSLIEVKAFCGCNISKGKIVRLNKKFY